MVHFDGHRRVAGKFRKKGKNNSSTRHLFNAVRPRFKCSTSNSFHPRFETHTNLPPPPTDRLIFRRIKHTVSPFRHLDYYIAGAIGRNESFLSPLPPRQENARDRAKISVNGSFRAACLLARILFQRIFAHQQIINFPRRAVTSIKRETREREKGREMLFFPFFLFSLLLLLFLFFVLPHERTLFPVYRETPP